MRKDLPCASQVSLVLPSSGFIQQSPTRGSTQKKAFSVFTEFYLGYTFMKAFIPKCSKLKVALDAI